MNRCQLCGIPIQSGLRCFSCIPLFRRRVLKRDRAIAAAPRVKQLHDTQKARRAEYLREVGREERR
jgi:hypothetical protein